MEAVQSLERSREGLPGVWGTDCRALPLVFSALLGYASDEKRAAVRLLGRRPRPHPGGRPAAV